MEETTFRKIQEADLPSVLDLYNHYIATTTATFRCEPISEDALRTFIFLDHKWYKAYVIQRGGEMAGFCFATQLKNHASYDRTAELGVYLKPEYTRRGLGGEAVRHMEKAATADGLKMLIASICGENAASLKLFEKLGYDRCGHFKRIGEKWGRVLDVVFFQKSLEGG